MSRRVRCGFMKMRIGYGKCLCVQLHGSTIKKIANLVGFGSMISLPVVGAPKIFRLEFDICRNHMVDEVPENIVDDKLYWVEYSKVPETFDSGRVFFEYYCTVSIGNPRKSQTVEQYYGEGGVL